MIYDNNASHLTVQEQIKNAAREAINLQTASLLGLNGSQQKSMTLAPLTKAGITPSGRRPVRESSITAIFPPGPLSGTATRSQLAKNK